MAMIDVVESRSDDESSSAPSEVDEGEVRVTAVEAPSEESVGVGVDGDGDGNIGIIKHSKLMLPLLHESIPEDGPAFVPSDQAGGLGPGRDGGGDCGEDDDGTEETVGISSSEESKEATEVPARNDVGGGEEKKKGRKEKNNDNNGEEGENADDKGDVKAAPSDECDQTGANDDTDVLDGRDEPGVGGEDGQDTEGGSSPTTQQQWERAAATLRSNPSLMTSSILKLALHNRPPLHVIEFMLSLNPDAAGVPRSGPSALQVAVRHHSSVEVVEAVVKACPYALFTGNGSYDPLTYAKIWRREDERLIRLLERPISDWIKPTKTTKAAASKEAAADAPTRKGGGGDAGTTATSLSYPPPSNSSTNKDSTAAPSSSRLSREERRELSNVKLITAAIVRAQKKQIAEAAEERRVMEAELRAVEQREARARKDLIKVFEGKVKKTAKANLVALDMKEKAFEARVNAIGGDITDLLRTTVERQERLDEERALRDEVARKTVEGAITSMRDDMMAAADRVERATTSFGTRLADLAVLVDRESVVNAAFRADARQRQTDLEERVENTIADCGGFVYHQQHPASCPALLPSFEVESIKGSGSSDPLFPEGDGNDDDCFTGIDETCIMGGSDFDDFGVCDDDENSFPFDHRGYTKQVQNSFSSDWNSRAGDSRSSDYSSSWRKASKMAAVVTKKKKVGRSFRWKRWFLKLRD